MIRIEIATESDTNLLSILGSQTYIESHGQYIEDKNDLNQYIKETFSIPQTKLDVLSPENRFYLIYFNEVVLGYAKLILNKKHKRVVSEKICLLDKIYILDEFIPMKVGQQFMHFLEYKAKELGSDTMWLTVYCKNTRAIRFYERNNFKEVGTQYFMVNGKGYENVILSKML